MTEWRDYSITASANSTITVANGGWPESTMTLPDVNNAARAMQSMMKRWLLDHQGQQASVGTSSTADVALSQVISTANATVILQEGDRFLFKAGIGNTGAYNLSVRSGTAHQVLTTNSQALHQGMIQAGGFYDVRWEQSSSAFYLLNPSIDPYIRETEIELGTAGSSVKVLGTFQGTGGELEIGTAASSVKINGTNVLDLTDEGAALVVGPGAGVHLEIGAINGGVGSGLQAKDAVNSADQLWIQPLGTEDTNINATGGNVEIGAAATSVKINGTNTVDISDEDAPLAVGPGDGIHLELGRYTTGSIIQAKSNATTGDDLFINAIAGGLVEIGAGGSTSIKLNGSTAPSLSNENAGVVIDNGASTHLELADNDIQAKSDATTATTLDLNPLGGRVVIDSNAGLTVTGQEPEASDANPALVVGTDSGDHLELGANSSIRALQAKSDATTATTLDLNPLGGVLRFPTYAVASLPASGTPASLTGAVAIALDLSGGASIVINDGTNWVTVGAASGRGTAD